MTKLKLAPWDGSEFIAEPDAQADLLADALESGDARYVAHALGLIAKARGMNRIAREAGVSRESLYKSLSLDGNPELATVMAVAKALQLELTARKAGGREAA
jgi:probable addiction module antidote protein